MAVAEARARPRRGQLLPLGRIHHWGRAGGVCTRSEQPPVPEAAGDLRKTMASAAVRTAGRRSIAQYKVRVAIWDTHSQFPGLRSALDRINAAQTLYGFEIVDLSYRLMPGASRVKRATWTLTGSPIVLRRRFHSLACIISAHCGRVDGRQRRDEIGRTGSMAGCRAGPASRSDLLDQKTFTCSLRGRPPIGVRSRIGARYRRLSPGNGFAHKGAHNLPQLLQSQPQTWVLTGHQKFCDVCIG